MTDQSIAESLIQLAIQQTALFLTITDRADPEYIARELFYNVTLKFREQQEPLHSLDVIEVAEMEFEVLANDHARGTLKVEQKGGAG